MSNDVSLPAQLLDNRRRMRFAQGGQWVRGGLALLGVVAYAVQYHLLRRVQLGQKVAAGTADAIDGGVLALTVGQLVVIIGAFVGLLLWFYRAYQNAHRLPLADPNYPASMAVWGWFIPVINLWYPYKIMAELGHYLGGFISPRNTITNPRWDYALVAWWALHLIILVFSRVTMSSAFTPTEASPIEDLLLYSRLLMAAETLTALSAAATLTLLKTLAPHERFLFAASTTAPAPTA
ncbi:DUF4328 domain-containing protein [Hymenobacter ruricola]|uniref:DUF4328 domain-containing protein n=1 Tax=Hymenobacter ruricola TaxID=2791023 RepID=A0ABS0I2J7_9BACT|nr:DUF4328 domain-containing protein [Hymenobacter ruricola]MBF9221153.1 DUF4328 domain-containing protein [Hymenobacter ruricola]